MREQGGEGAILIQNRNANGEARSNLCRITEVDQPDFTPIGIGHLPTLSCRVLERPVRRSRQFVRQSTVQTSIPPSDAKSRWPLYAFRFQATGRMILEVLLQLCS